MPSRGSGSSSPVRGPATRRASPWPTWSAARATEKETIIPTFSQVEISPRVSTALAAGEPVVALESTIISHGLPRPANLAAARAFEGILGGQGVSPATIALIDGVPKVGLLPEDLERIAAAEAAGQASRRGIGTGR